MPLPTAAVAAAAVQQGTLGLRSSSSIGSWSDSSCWSNGRSTSSGWSSSSSIGGEQQQLLRTPAMRQPTPQAPPIAAALPHPRLELCPPTAVPFLLFLLVAPGCTFCHRASKRGLITALEVEVAAKLEQLKLLRAENEVLQMKTSILQRAVDGRETQVCMCVCIAACACACWKA